MKLEQLRQEDNSSGYGSRESLTDGFVSTTQHDLAEQQPNKSCTKSLASYRKNSSSQVIDSQLSSMSTDAVGAKTHRHSHTYIPSPSLTAENKRDNSCKKFRRYSVSSSSLDKSATKKANWHSQCSFACDVTVKQKLSPNSPATKSAPCGGDSSHSSLDEHILVQLNKDLAEKNKLLMEENNQLIEELKITKRWFQGTLSDLNFQLSAGESKIMILQETISAYKEALAEKEDIALHSNSTSGVRRDSDHQTSLNVKNIKKTSIDRPGCIVDKGRNTFVSGTQRSRKSSCSSSSSLNSSVSCRDSASLESGVKLNTSLLLGPNFEKRKEKLKERNQHLKTDIELLKEKTRSAALTSSGLTSSVSTSSEFSASELTLTDSLILTGNGNVGREENTNTLENVAEEDDTSENVEVKTSTSVDDEQKRDSSRNVEGKTDVSKNMNDDCILVNHNREVCGTRKQKKDQVNSEKRNKLIAIGGKATNCPKTLTSPFQLEGAQTLGEHTIRLKEEYQT